MLLVLLVRRRPPSKYTIILIAVAPKRGTVEAPAPALKAPSARVGPPWQLPSRKLRCRRTGQQPAAERLHAGTT